MSLVVMFLCLVEKVKKYERGTVSVVMEHFNLSQQALLDAYMRGGLEPGGLQAGYAQGEEGHNIQCYAALLEYARLNPDRAVLCIRIRSKPKNFLYLVPDPGKNFLILKIFDEFRLFFIYNYFNCHGLQT